MVQERGEDDKEVCIDDLIYCTILKRIFPGYKRTINPLLINRPPREPKVKPIGPRPKPSDGKQRINKQNYCLIPCTCFSGIYRENVSEPTGETDSKSYFDA